MKTIKTILHYYNFDISKESEKKEYAILCEKLQGMGLRVFDSISSDHSSFYQKIAKLDGRELILETEHLFNNQWNTEPIDNDKNGLRVFDWSEPIFPNRKIKKGMWLDQTNEMKEVRTNTCKCGYCGKNYYKPKFDFCNSCLSSEYLTTDQLTLLKLMPIDKEERRSNVIVPQSLIDKFLEVQTYAQNVTRPAKELKASQKRLLEDIGEMENKAAGLKRLQDIGQWLFDHNINTSNFIFYDHSQKVCIGWRKELTSEDVERWKKIFIENQFPVIWSDMIEYKLKK